MEHIHFVIYRLKSIIIIYCIYYFYSFLIICIHSEIEFIKPMDDVKIQRKTIIFTKEKCYRTVFINKMINSGIRRMFISFCNICIYIFYFVSQVLCIWTNYNYSYFSMKKFIYLFVMILFFFYLII
jgi:hypothetical protein